MWRRAPTVAAEPEVIKKGKKDEDADEKEREEEISGDREIAESVKAIVGLGNPGAKYRGTRHNVGFAVVDELARRWAIGFESAPFDALIAKWRPADGEPVLLAKPLTFMNASGEAAGALARYFKIETADLLIVVDEVQLPLGRLRARARGSAGGHNGLKSVIAHLGDDFRGCASASGVGPKARKGEPSGIWPTTCCRGSRRMNGRRSSA